MLHRTYSVPFAFLIIAWFSTAGTCRAGGRFFVVPGAAVAIYSGWPGYRAHPFDDSYDYPAGYGEYAVYGPWAYRGYGSCSAGWRKVRTSAGWQFRTVRICN